MSDMKREFKDLIRFEHYENLNSEIKGNYDKAYAVKCVNGTFVGTEEHGVASWLGIPYAKPPVGARRFKAPEYVDASDKVFEAKYFGKGAFGSMGYPDCVQTLMSEDCLYLNIWLNADDKTAKKPVMVWIHGGAYVVGSGSQSEYSWTSRRCPVAKTSRRHPATACWTRPWRSGGCTRTSPLSAGTRIT